MEPARFLCHRSDEGRGGEEEKESSSQLEQEQEQDGEVSCALDIYVHDARGIHNICIYANQDVYAKFALTSAPDDGPGALSTRVARGGGSSPRFDEHLPPLRVRRGRLAVDVLKCEVWMRSCATRLLDDQLLGFALVPLAAVAAAQGARIVAGEFELSSTDLLHSPAGTVRFSIALRSGIPGDADACAPPEPSIASEVVILSPAPVPAPHVDYARIEFTDLKVEQENDAMAVQYLPFLHSSSGDGVPMVIEDCEMSTTSPRGDKSALSSDGSTSTSKNAASTASTVSEDRVVVAAAAAAVSSSAEAAAERLPSRQHDADEATTVLPTMPCRSPDTPTSCSGKAAKGDVFKPPLALGDMDIDMEAEQSAMQRQIMEMYVKSMQQFSESLAKMQLPIELGRGDVGVAQKEEAPDNNNVMERQQVKKDGARVFYGSRAFF